ncbi:hypothetical protein PYW07_006602 [Mythimna separata]|uniref:PiggyBac transposable element-derived protein domain-containing protein n=1 Tax=Mythimna separata TaxID=271217 RepID=A0AAD7YTZ0_MYTSE|nr:hypothetical protein PYW07_006602 [Mythimna separata]
MYASSEDEISEEEEVSGTLCYPPYDINRALDSLQNVMEADLLDVLAGDSSHTLRPTSPAVTVPWQSVAPLLTPLAGAVDTLSSAVEHEPSYLSEPLQITPPVAKKSRLSVHQPSPVMTPHKPSSSVAARPPSPLTADQQSLSSVAQEALPSMAAQQSSSAATTHQPSSSAAAQLPSSAATAHQHLSPEAAQQRSSIVTAQQPSYPETVQQPSSTAATHQYLSLAAAQQPSSVTATHQPSSSMGDQQPLSPVAVHPPSPLMAAQQPSSPAAAHVTLQGLIDKVRDWSENTTGFAAPNFTRKLKSKKTYNNRSLPIHYFLDMFPSEIFDIIVANTNSYASFMQSLNWTPTNATEIRAYLGMIIMMGLHPLSELELYWSSDPFYHNPIIAAVMPCRRFKKLTENLHLSDRATEAPRTQPGYDKL